MLMTGMIYDKPVSETTEASDPHFWALASVCRSVPSIANKVGHCASDLRKPGRKLLWMTVKEETTVLGLLQGFSVD